MNQSRKLTEKQETVFSFIRQSIRESGFPPTVREVAETFGITAKAAYDHLKALEKKGYIQTSQGKSRSIVILDQEEMPSGISIPLLGNIAAGVPILAEENIDEYLTFPESLVGTGELFALRVRGDSMEDGGIFNGDIAVLRSQNTAENGEIVAAMIDGEATLKRFRRTAGKIQLIPDNPSYAPIEPDYVEILGKLKAVFRSYS